LTPTQIFTLGPGGTVTVAGTYDNTVPRNYVLEFAPPNSFRILRDGVQIHAGTNGSPVSANRVFIGDGTGGANASAEILSLRFLQGTSVPVELSKFSID
jgi:hypothetical protein